jgi:hypothetical protein
MNTRDRIAHALAAAFAAGPLEVPRLLTCVDALLVRRGRWTKPLCERIATAYRGQVRPRTADVERLIREDLGYQRAKQSGRSVRLRRTRSFENPELDREMCPAAGMPEIDVPNLLTAAQLAEWLEITPGELEWFADLRRMERKRHRPGLRHYTYRAFSKGAHRVRLIEAPKSRLREIQRRILHGILDPLAPHEAAHGFRAGRSIKTFAAPHVGKVVVLRIDLEDFFPSISAARIEAIFRAIGYPDTVASLLAGLCTNSAPDGLWEELAGGLSAETLRHARWRYAEPHLPQGAPTSPALANLAAHRLDCRLAPLAESAGATYTRYADDLAFSGDESFARGIGRFRMHVCATILEERWRVNFRKLRVMRRGVRQHLAGIVVNEKTNIRRDDFDTLKAILHNCLKHGPIDQNRNRHADFRAHLGGRVAHIAHLHPSRGIKLKAMLEAIDWEA